MDINIDTIAYVVCTRREGRELFLCHGVGNGYIVRPIGEVMPALFGSDDEALDACVSYTSFKGWCVKAVKILDI